MSERQEIDCPFCKAVGSVHSVDSYYSETARVVCEECDRATWTICFDNWKSLGFHARQMHTAEYAKALYERQRLERLAED